MISGLPQPSARRASVGGAPAVLLTVFFALGGGCGGGAQTRKVGADAGAPTDTATLTDVAPADRGSIVVGQPCGTAAQCASGFCFDGVCCKTDCSSACQTCAAAGSVGTCLPAEVGTDPRKDCDDQGAASCQHDGFCDGAGACESYPAGVSCQQGGCTGSALSFAGRCDGLGTCLTMPSQTCAPFSCAATGQCKTTCTTDADCVAGNTCKNGSCGKSPIGATCAAGTDCNSGFCAQGICCATACAGTCMSCAIARSAGSCTGVPAGQDPLAQCAASTTSVCGTDGFCDGAGSCRLAVSGTVCGTDACTGGTETLAGRCDGVGDCVAGTTEGCSPYLCGAGGDCLTTCATTADCATGYTCSGTICCNAGSCALEPLGATCAAATDCASGFCQQGVCCASSCTGTCLSCAIAGKLGTCSPIAAGQAPTQTSQCPAALASCGNDGLCNGAGACEVYGASTTCAPATCAGSTFTPTRSCDGAGSCRTVTSFTLRSVRLRHHRRRLPDHLRHQRRLRIAEQLRRHELRQAVERRRLQHGGAVQLGVLRPECLLLERLHHQLQLVRARRLAGNLHLRARRHRPAQSVQRRGRHQLWHERVLRRHRRLPEIRGRHRLRRRHLLRLDRNPRRQLQRGRSLRDTRRQLLLALSLRQRGLQDHLHHRRRLPGAQRLQCGRLRRWLRRSLL